MTKRTALLMMSALIALLLSGGCATPHSCPLSKQALIGNCSSTEKTYDAAVRVGHDASKYDSVFQHPDLIEQRQQAR